MKKSLLFCVVFVLNGLQIFAQKLPVKKDTVTTKKTNKLELNLDIANRYIWRGQSWGGDYVVLQPTVDYEINDRWTVGFWASTNFKKDYFYPDGIAGKGYQEIDFNLSYAVNSFLTVQVWDYYWPSVERVEGVDNGFFNYGNDSTKTVDATLLFDFSDHGFPLNLTLSTLVAGNDYRYDGNDENPKQNYTTYVEAGYSWEELFQKITFDLSAGAVLNNQAEYYTSGDYDKVSVVNLGLKAMREFKLTERFTMPLSLNYIHNAATKNIDYFGKDFLIAGITFHYE